MAILFAGAICGALSIGFVSTKFGRKRGLYVSIGCGILAVLLAIISCHVIFFHFYLDLIKFYRVFAEGIKQNWKG